MGMTPCQRCINGQMVKDVFIDLGHTKFWTAVCLQCGWRPKDAIV